MRNKENNSREIAERPVDYLGPNLNPDGLVLTPQQLGEGVDALMANILLKDNNGVIIGEKYALVIDAGINGAIAQQIQTLVRQLTEKPIRYLVNTTYHGDHTFGNAAFPEEVTSFFVGPACFMHNETEQKIMESQWVSERVLNGTFLSCQG